MTSSFPVDALRRFWEITGQSPPKDEPKELSDGDIVRMLSAVPADMWMSAKQVRSMFLDWRVRGQVKVVDWLHVQRLIWALVHHGILEETSIKNGLHYRLKDEQECLAFANRLDGNLSEM